MVWLWDVPIKPFLGEFGHGIGPEANTKAQSSALHSQLFEKRALAHGSPLNLKGALVSGGMSGRDSGRGSFPAVYLRARILFRSF